jgi:3D (Asp-Asp-Asp) domain-containing protein
LRTDDANLAAKSRSAVLDLYSLEVRLSTANRRLTALASEAHELRSERVSITRQLRLARLDARLSQDRLATRVRFIYDHGSASTLELLLGAKSLDEAMTQLDGVNRVATANQSVLVQLRSAQGHLIHLSHALALRGQRLAAATGELAATVAALGRTRAERSAYIIELGRRRALDSAQIDRLDARARAAEARTQQLTRQPPRAAAAVAPSTIASPAVAGTMAAPVATAGQGRLVVTATGYGLSGTTSTGIPVGWGVAAVDPSVIPLGTHLTIPGYGEAIAADTGSAVRGSTIDLWFPTLAQARAWGRQSVTISLR